ncbi:MAG: UbiD family decarboxylase [Fibrobacteraceae bacterium]|nr:UbiD family decarboxylase [Fibrobacteraceae bacterium]
MAYHSLEAALLDLEKHGMLLRIKEATDPNLEMAKIAEVATKAEMPALLFENVKGSPFRATANIFGTKERVHFLFRDTFQKAEAAIRMKADPLSFLKEPKLWPKLPAIGRSALPFRTTSVPLLKNEIDLSELPQIKLHEKDGGAFLTLPQVFTRDPSGKNIFHSNLGMYRVQISGNNYIQNKECGLHYQIERDIAKHHQLAIKEGMPLKVSIWLGGPPAHSIAAIMPLPPKISEIVFAGLFAGHSFRYANYNGWDISTESDFCILGEIASGLKPEGPFGDHIGYYSAKHDFPYLNVKKVFHKKNAIFPFTTVGRPPQEDSVIGELIGELIKPMIPKSIPGIFEVNAVDAAGVHPLLLALGSERYQPYLKDREPMELLKEANALLGFNQVSLSKYVFIAAKEDNANLSTHKIPEFFMHVLERADWKRDIHFQTETTIDTLDYSGKSLNHGSKAIIAAAGEKIRELGTSRENFGETLKLPKGFSNTEIVFPGTLVIQAEPMANIQELCKFLAAWENREKFPLITLADDSHFTARSIENWLWITFTRSDPAEDIYGTNESIFAKHWSCESPLIIDARSKERMQSPVEENPALEAKARDILSKAQQEAKK